MLRSAEYVLWIMLDTCLGDANRGTSTKTNATVMGMGARMCVKNVAADDADRSKSMGRFL